MMILIKKAIRDLWRAKMRTISIVLAIVLSVGLGIGMVNATKNAIESFDKRTELTNYEDISIQFDMTNINISKIESIQGVETVTGRLVIPTQAKIGDKRFETDWISSPYYTHEPFSRINGYQLVMGDYVSSAFAKECMVGNLFAKERGIEPGDRLSVFHENTSIELEVVGVVASPEYIYVIGEGGWPQPSLLLPLFTTYEMMADEFGVPSSTFNEILILVKDGYDAREVAQELEAALTFDGVRITRSMLGTQEADYQFSRVDANAMGQIGWAFGLIILGVTAVVIYNSLTRLIASQRSYIGVMGALGGRTKKILLHYSLFGFFMGLIGSILGVVLGVVISKLTISEYAKLIGLVEPDTTIYWIYHLLFCIIGIAISTGAALIGSLRVLKIGPREALTSQYHMQVFSKEPFIERIFDGLSKKRAILPRVPLRNLGRNKVRTSITIIAMAFSLILVFSCLVMATLFIQPLHKNYGDYEKWDLRVTLADKEEPELLAETLDDLEMRGIEGEVHLDDYLPVINNGEMDFVHIQAFEEDSRLRCFNVVEGKEDFHRGVLVGSILASELDLKPGSKVTFSIGGDTADVTVVGITGELLDDSVLMTMELAQQVSGTDGVANALIIDMGQLSRDEVEALLREEFTIASFSYTEDIVDGMETMLDGLVSMFLIFIAFGVVAEVLFISTTVVLNILDRDMEFISLRAMGVTPGKIRRMVVSESVFLLAFGLLIGLPLGYYITVWAFDYIAQDLMFFELEVPVVIYAVTALIALISTVSASYVSGSHITKLKLADTIRQRTTI